MDSQFTSLRYFQGALTKKPNTFLLKILRR
jgi:hypothetical protein